MLFIAIEKCERTADLAALIVPAQDMVEVIHAAAVWMKAAILYLVFVIR
jgi:hypothetical protein